MTAEAQVRSNSPEVMSGVNATGGYRPHLDGLRAVAVYLVLLFHAGSDRFSGGYVGVDVFFVLSGFLVTQLLLRDLVSEGSISFRRFYARRFRRLLPAAFVVLVVTALVFQALASPVEVAGASGGFKASFLYSANWHFIAQSADYFGADLTGNPVLHFWSLAVEEQFYLAWPLVLGGLFVVSRRVGARQWQVMRLVVAVAAVASLWSAWSLRDSDPNRAYYGTDTRAYQLMAGALVALTPELFARLGRFGRAARLVGAVSVGGLLVIASSWVDLAAIERGIAVTAITVVALIALETARSGLVHRVLSAGSLVYLGKISYGTYLWHWPVIIVIARSFDVSVITTITVTALVATALASLSFQLMEHPVRVSLVLDRYRTPVIVTGLAISVVSALVVIPAIVEPSAATAIVTARSGLATTGFTPVPTGLDWNAIKLDFARLSDCLDKPASACTIVRGGGPHILLMGDSHAGMMTPAFVAIAEREGLTLSVSTRGGCPWQRDLYIPPLAVSGQPVRVEDCKKAKDDAYDRVIPTLNPDVVIAMNLAYETPGQRIQYRGPEQSLLRNGSPEWDTWLDRTTLKSLAELTTGGRKVVILEPVPYRADKFDPLACLSQASVVEECRYLANLEPTGLERMYRRFDSEQVAVWSVDLDRLVCPYLPICDPIVDHLIVKIDVSHLSSAFASSLVPAIDGYLKSNGIIP